MAPKVDVPLSLIKTAALSGIGLVWITVKAFKMAWNIISTSPEEGTLKPVAKEIVICEECQEHFIDDEKEFEYGKFLCEACSDYELKEINFLKITMPYNFLTEFLSGFLNGTAIVIVLDRAEWIVDKINEQDEEIEELFSRLEDCEKKNEKQKKSYVELFSRLKDCVEKS